MSTKAVVPTTTSSDSPSTYEDTFVHTVYDTIAHHFSSTRYKPWPVVAAFLAGIPSGYIGIDAGCGNGKYLIAPKDREGTYWTIGMDRSARLLEIAKRAGDQDRECVLGDVLDTPWRTGIFDFGISIATVHHLSTPDRRRKAIRSLLKCLSSTHGRGLIYVWSMKQDGLSKRAVPLENTDPNRKGQDVFVPWVLSEGSGPRKSAAPVQICQEDTGLKPGINVAGSAYNRYYHMFEEGELRELLIAAATELEICIGSPGIEKVNSNSLDDATDKRYLEILRDGWERSNYYIEFRLFQE